MSPFFSFLVALLPLAQVLALPQGGGNGGNGNGALTIAGLSVPGCAVGCIQALNTTGCASPDDFACLCHINGSHFSLSLSTFWDF